MGANYYMTTPALTCGHCGHAEGGTKLHIGKSSGGWCFALHVMAEESLNSLADWEKAWENDGVTIVDEYDTVISVAEMRSIITERSRTGGALSAPSGSLWYKQNHAVPGPNGLARHAVSEGHCIGHGQGTWDLITGYFS